MPLSPFIAVIGIVFILSVALLLILALEEKFDEDTTSEFEDDIAYHTMLAELREMQSSRAHYRIRGRHPWKLCSGWRRSMMIGLKLGHMERWVHF
jgi:hypothetical protein